MNYSDFTREQLLKRIEELEILNRALQMEKQQKAGLVVDWADCLGRWYWNAKTNAITFDLLHPQALGYDNEEIPEYITYPFIKKVLHPEDYQVTLEAMAAFLSGREAQYTAEYRIRAKDGTYRWFNDRGGIVRSDSAGKPLFLSGMVFDITERKKKELDLEVKNKVLMEMSSIDGLTKVGNHRAVVEHLQTEIKNTGDTGRPLSVAVFDVDDFKTVNDRSGHIAGDQVLADAAGIIKASIRDTDFVGRYGGDEFLVVFSNADSSTAFRISERIRQTIERSFSDKGITVSGGVRQYKGRGPDRAYPCGGHESI
jgi:diguanylate cyclase (GGDEF)-like protein/PAS domain S-box-containing protein